MFSGPSASRVYRVRNLDYVWPDFVERERESWERRSADRKYPLWVKGSPEPPGGTTSALSLGPDMPLRSTDQRDGPATDIRVRRQHPPMELFDWGTVSVLSCAQARY